MVHGARHVIFIRYILGEMSFAKDRTSRFCDNRGTIIAASKPDMSIFSSSAHASTYKKGQSNWNRSASAQNINWTTKFVSYRSSIRTTVMSSSMGLWGSVQS